MAPKFLCIIWVVTVNMDLILIEFVENCGIPRPLKMHRYFLIDFWQIWILTSMGCDQTCVFFNNMNQKIPGGHKSKGMTQKYTLIYIFIIHIYILTVSIKWHTSWPSKRLGTFAEVLHELKFMLGSLIRTFSYSFPSKK